VFHFSTYRPSSFKHLSGVILLHDKAGLHTARLTQETLEHLVLEVLPQPPYSQDLAHSDYHHFGPMKKMLGGGRTSHQMPRCNQSFNSGLDSSQYRSLHQAIRSLSTDGTNKLGWLKN